MKYTTSVGKEIELIPVSLADKTAYCLIRKVIARSKEFEATEANSDAWWDKRSEVHNVFTELCRHLAIPETHVGESDLADILVFIQTGDFPDEKKV